MINYNIERARNLARELLLRDDSRVAADDTPLMADALSGYAEALNKKTAGREYDDLARAAVADLAVELSRLLAEGGVSVLGPTDSELASRALAFYCRSRPGRRAA